MVARSSVARWLFAVVLGFATAVSRALAGEPASDPVQSPPPALIAVVDEECPANDEAPLAGVMAFIDPETGELRAPTAEEMRILMAASAGQARLKGAVVQKAVQHPNGMISMVLGEEHMNDVVVQKSAGGGLTYVCVPTSKTSKTLNGQPTTLEER